MQNLAVFMEPSGYAPEISSRSGNMILNRFCIDEDGAFELSGVYYFKTLDDKIFGYDREVHRKAKGKENS